MIIADIILQSCNPDPQYHKLQCSVLAFDKALNTFICTPTGFPGSDYIVSLVPEATCLHHCSPCIV